MRAQPGYEQKALPAGERRGRLKLAAPRDGREDAVTVHRDARLLVADLSAGERIAHSKGCHDQRLQNDGPEHRPGPRI